MITRYRNGSTRSLLVAALTTATGIGACGGGGSGLDGPQQRQSACADTTYPAQDKSAYVLPYQVGESYTVGQTNCVNPGSGSHARGTRAEFAYDFAMPIGTSLLAARAGTVIYVEENFADETDVQGEENTIVIRHEDDTLSNYGHLTILGALVEVDQTVQQGEIIGVSGDSGASTEPHLHFEILTCKGEPITFTPIVSFNRTCRSLPTTFRNTGPHPQGLAEGETYEAQMF